MLFRLWFGVIFFSLAALCVATENSALRIGVYYFPGWKDGVEPSRAKPWKPIEEYGAVKPTLGWYSEGDDNVSIRHLEWMAEYGIDYVIYDWYWKTGRGPRLNHAVESYLRLPFSKHQRKFSVMWANHNDAPASESELFSIVDYLVLNFFSNPHYEKIDGRPVFFIFSPENLDRRARLFGYDAKRVLDYFRKRTVDLLGVSPFFVGATHAVEKRVNFEYLSHGYDAYSAYNYHYGVSGVFNGAKYSHSYGELTSGYEVTWKWMLNNSKIPYILPVTAGWNRRPWGGSLDPLHDNSGGDPLQFAKHILSAVELARLNPGKTLSRIVICCWNEFGEGSYIEPTDVFGFGFLEAVRRAIN